MSKINYLKNTTCYLCGPIAAATTSEMSDWREEIKPFLKSLDINVKDPLKKDKDGLGETPEDRKKFRDLILKEDWKTHKELFWPVARWDLSAVNKSDFIIFNYNTDIPTVGSWHEILVAHQQKKPILLKYDKKQLDKFNFWIPMLIKTDNFFPTWDSMFQELSKVNNGVYNSSYWIF